MEKVCIKSMLPGQVQEYMVSLGEPSYRGKQVFRWLTQGVTSFDEMSDLSKSLREKLILSQSRRSFGSRFPPGTAR